MFKLLTSGSLCQSHLSPPSLSLWLHGPGAMPLLPGRPGVPPWRSKTTPRAPTCFPLPALSFSPLSRSLPCEETLARAGVRRGHRRAPLRIVAIWSRPEASHRHQYLRRILLLLHSQGTGPGGPEPTQSSSPSLTAAASSPLPPSPTILRPWSSPGRADAAITSASSSSPPPPQESNGDAKNRPLHPRHRRCCSSSAVSEFAADCLPPATPTSPSCPW